MQFNFMSGRTVMVVSVAAVLLALASAGCSSSSGGRGGGDSPEALARRVIEAAIRGDSDAVLNEMAPDARDTWEDNVDVWLDDLSGCASDDVQYLVAQDGDVTAEFAQPCGFGGEDLDGNPKRIDRCYIDTEQLSGRYYLDFYLDCRNAD